jgi:phosphoribosylaminoimidazole-succinocarboxamide synthase
MKLGKLYSGSVKEVLGPLELHGESAVVFQFTDAYSVFDWGRMPDAIPHKGEALALMTAYFFERLQDAAGWREFSSSPEAQALRKGIGQVRGELAYPERDGTPDSLSSRFNEEGERLQREGLSTHYHGVVGSLEPWRMQKLADTRSPASAIAVREVHVARPTLKPVLGRAVLDYQPTRTAPAPRLVPLEVVFRWSCPEGSSLPAFAERDRAYWNALILPAGQSAPRSGDVFAFPVVELFTKLESADRRLTLTEALAISGISAEQLEQVLVRTFWVSGFLRWEFARRGIELEDGKLEWGLGAGGEIFLVDAIGPDELRLKFQGVPLSKEILRSFYRGTPWYEALTAAKASGESDWKRKVGLAPHPLPRELLHAMGLMYRALTERITGQSFWADTPPLEKVASSLEEVRR